MQVLSVLLFSISINIDCFSIALAYRLKRTKISFFQMMIISLMTAIGTALSMQFGAFLLRHISLRFASRLGGGILLAMGVWMIGDTFLAFLSKKNNHKEEVELRCITWRESLVLSVALSLNNVALGISAGVSGIPAYDAFVATFLISGLLLILGQWFGERAIFRLFGRYASFVSGALLILLGVLAIFM